MTLSQHGLPILFTLFLWWFSTGVILYLDGLPRRTFRWSMTAATVVLVAALYALSVTATETGVAAAYCAFTSAVLVWGWIEMSFLMGFITGPRTTPCPLGSSGWRRTRFAIEAVLHHELALLGGALIIAVLTWDAPNALGLWTYLVLWVSRQSAKLNVFLGARNLSESFLPDHLQYLQTYFRRKPMNPLFPFSVTLGTAAAVMLWRQAMASGLSAGEAAGFSFLATLMTLAVLEHWFLMLPIPSEVLWKWGLLSRRAPDAETALKDDSALRIRSL